MQRKIFRYIEKCLYEYPTNLIKLAGLVEELNIIRATGDVSGQNYNVTGGGAGNGYADPVASYFAKIEQAEQRINKLAQQLNQITALYDGLKNSQTLDAVTSADYVLLLQRFYFGALPVNIFLQESDWGRSKFYSRRLGLIRLAQEYLRL